jgi:NADPH-dependent curcumin reductase CurA
VSRRSPTFVSDLRAVCGDGVDVYFDNVGGVVLDAMMPLMADHGRIVCCGAVANYGGIEDSVHVAGPRGLPQLVINKVLRIQGVLTADWDNAVDQLAGRRAQGGLTPIRKTWVGLDSAPRAFLSMLAGDNVGQVVVQVGTASS